ncbi:MAG: hypothetical protein JWQ94_1740 [Tardiphaga sp.]|nr:hypothetical protein [Tardiphaga sp.]
MQLFSVSLKEIEDDLIHYFATTFPSDPAPIFTGTNVKKRYRYTNESWGDLADTLSLETWMIHLGVVLIQDDMRDFSTIEQLAVLISKHIRHVVSSKAPQSVIPLNTIMRASISRISPTPKTTAAAAPRNKTKKSKKSKKSKTTTTRKTKK